MKISLQPGTYVVAVSGGVDSVVLLHLLKNQPDVRLVVAHFDHGIRPDSHLDRRFVQSLAKTHKLPFAYARGKLGPRASEAKARAARYAFLHRVLRAAKATAIVTAHHEDDLLETAFLNISRGSGRKGLSSLQSNETLRRPLLHYPKSALLEYARLHGLHWNEDSTNAEVRYRRNYLRHRIMPKLGEEDRYKFRKLIEKTRILNAELDRLLTNELHVQPARTILERHWFIMLPHVVAREALATWLRSHGLGGFTKKDIERITVAAKTWHPSKQIDVNSKFVITVSTRLLALNQRDR